MGAPTIVAALVSPASLIRLTQPKMVCRKAVSELVNNLFFNILKAFLLQYYYLTWLFSLLFALNDFTFLSHYLEF